METKIKIIFTLGIPYIFFCAGLYQIAYWLPFNINGFSYLSISDIIMSFILPFIYGSFFTMVVFAYTNNMTYSIFPHGEGNKEPASQTKKLIWVAIEGLYGIGFLLILFYLDFKSQCLYLPAYCLAGLYVVLSDFFIKKNLIQHNRTNLLALYFFIVLPVTSFTTGSKNAYEIFDNEKFDYSNNILPKTTLKFLGKTSDYYIFISFDNKNKYFFTASETKVLNLKSFKSNKTNN
jgi:hypothetical protein